MNQRFLHILFLLFLSSITMAQLPSICQKPEKEKMTSLCADACIICDIDGFTGRNNSNIQGQAPPGFCTSVVHHMQWIGFVAGTPDITLQVRAFNCVSGRGIEVGIYESLDCKTFKLVSNCNTDLNNNTSGTFKNTSPLTVGQYYYFVMDGNGDDICDYTVTVLQGSTKVDPLTGSGEIKGQLRVCPNLKQTYTTTPQKGATVYTWTVNGVKIENNIKPTLDYTFPAEGEYEISVKAANVCNEAPPSFYKVMVKNIEPTKQSKILCLGECWKIGDSTLCKTGEYRFTYKNPAGCDSIFVANLTVLSAERDTLTYTICSTDEFKLGNKTFNKAGTYTETFKNQYNCDSIIVLNLKTIICTIDGDIKATNIDCWGKSTGKLAFNVQNGTPPFQYEWEKVGEQNVKGNGIIQNIKEDIIVSNLTKGTYLVTIYNPYDTVILQQIITEPSKLTHKSQLSVVGKYQVACADGKTGTIMLSAKGGTPPYTYQWKDISNTTNILTNLAAAQYAYTITDANNCTLDSVAILTAPPPLVLDVNFQNLTCDGFNSGKIEVKTASGGVEPYQFALKNGAFSTVKSFTKLAAGDYTLTIKDAYNCTLQKQGILISPDIPTVDAGKNQAILLADSTKLTATATQYKTIQWTPANTLYCANCLDTEAKPVKSTLYHILVTSKDGCTAKDSVLISVKKVRKFYAPNAFSPNSDGSNDQFTLYASRLVTQIKSLRIYDRWGELLFERFDFQPNNLDLGWDGTFRGELLQDNVFVWYAEIEFLDGETELFKGDLHLIR